MTTEEEFTSGDCGGFGTDDYDPSAAGDDLVDSSVESSDVTAGIKFDAKLIIIIAVGVAVIFLVILSCIYCRQYREVKDQSKNSMGLAPTQYGYPSPQPQSINLNNSQFSMGSSQSTRV